MTIKWTPSAKQKYQALLLDVRDKDGYRAALKLRKEVNEMDGGSASVHHLLTADEFIAQMEPRIRSLFR